MAAPFLLPLLVGSVGIVLQKFARFALGEAFLRAVN